MTIDTRTRQKHHEEMMLASTKPLQWLIQLSSLPSMVAACRLQVQSPLQWLMQPLGAGHQVVRFVLASTKPLQWLMQLYSSVSGASLPGLASTKPLQWLMQHYTIIPVCFNKNFNTLARTASNGLAKASKNRFCRE